MRRAPAAAWALGAALVGAAATPAAAHPHGTLDCAAQVQAGPGGVSGIALTLTLDAASSAALQGRLQAQDDGSAPPTREARLFADLVSGMFRQSGWMLKLQPLDADGQPQAAALALADPVPATWRRLADGRLQVAVQLRPEAAAGPAPASHRLACQDPDWYWATGFAEASQFSVAPPCRAELDAMGSLAEQAQALQAQARRAGLPGADRVPDALLGTRDQRAPGGTLHCPAG